MDFSLTETTIMSAVRPGFTIGCGVLVSVLEGSQKTDEVPGEEFFAGVKIEQRTIHLPKGGSGEIVLKTTIPVACQYIDGLPIDDQCQLTLEMGKKDVGRCTGDVQGTTDCSNVLASLTANGTFEPAEIRFPIVTVDINYNDKSVFDIDLRFGSHTSPLWHNYVLPSVRVIVEDTDEHKNKLCYSHIDPHMKTSDGRHYEQQRNAGVYMMYINKAYDIEVQQKTKPCNRNYAMCACGVAVRAGKDVFMINRCGAIHFIDFVHCGEGGILDVLEVNSEKYRILTPIGTRIEIHLYGGYYEGTMNIDIYMAPKDFNKTEGLCGIFDNNVNNEFLGSNGQQLPNENVFAESWRMDSDTQNRGLKEKNLFINPDRSLQSWKERNHLYCFCQNGTANCSSTQYYTCSFPNNITPLKCHVSQGFRKKRGTDTHMKELRRLFDLMNSVDPPLHYLYKRQAEAASITAEDALEACTGLINGSLAVQHYSDLSASENSEQVINNCAYDVEVGGTLVWASAHVESYNDVVKNMIDLQPEYAANNTERIDVFLANTCPSNCTGNGNCTLVDTSGEGVCVCDTFYHGADCSIDERDPLIIDDIETGGECDTAERSDDCQCFAIRSGAILRSIQCTVKTFKISINGEEEMVSEFRSNGSYEDIFTGVCCSDLNKFDVDAFAVKYEVSASNDGINYGNIKTVFVFDSTCQSTVYDGNTNGTVVLNTTSGCFIDNTCYFDGEVSQFNTCLGCNASVNATGWSEAPCTTTTASTTTTTNPTTTVEPTTTTEEPTTTTTEPTTTIAEPTTITAKPATTTEEPTITTADSTTTTAEPKITTAEPTTITTEPPTTTAEPTITTAEPKTTTTDPTTTTAEPMTTTTEPTTTTSEPTTTTAEPTTANAEPSTTTAEPTTTTAEPTTTTTEPATTSEEPTTTTAEPTTTTTEPTTTTEEPTTTTADPTTTTTEPSTTTAEPTITTAEPTTPTAEPTTTTSEPSTTTAESTTITAEPTTATTEPTTTTAEPMTTNAEPTTNTAEPTTISAEPTTTSEVPMTSIAESTTTSTEPTTTTAEPAATTAEPTTTTEEHRTTKDTN
ncbi:von Willebrand factor D and EGF domain-containing protein-like [Mya arenaria]|uniref:von Willebrand factor D and EGF domain-containing protein-like n=1 Tax=Mya arenaria TaxID=6604 RepID=UPI0022E2FBD8|nr:von Willebrand factor D and EGF domain-containing protein-like [Mya arenaria]